MTSLLLVNCTLNLFITIIILWTLSFTIDYLRTLWLIFFFWRKTTYFLNMVCHWSQPDTLSTCFMEGFCFYIATFTPLIARILLCLHMQTNSVFEIVLYADQINILHLHNELTLTWILHNRMNPCLWSFKDIQLHT